MASYLKTIGFAVSCCMFLAGQAMALNYNVTVASLTNHNTSAYPAYNETNFSANFGNSTWVNQDGATMPVDPTLMDESLNPNTPGHVSKTDVHTLIPNRPDLRWFAHATCWFGENSHINIGLNNNTTSYVAAMITDMKNRGFNGIVVDWYGEGDQTDGVAQKVKAYLATLTNNTFHYIIMVDSGLQGGDSTNNIQAQIQYCQSQYFTDTNYEHEPVSTGFPILMFFNVRNVVGQSAMNSMKAYLGGAMVWVEQGTSYLTESWEDECFEWADTFDTGVNTNDPFNLTAVTNDFPTIRTSGKKAFGAMCGRFNGTLTKSVAWSEGKYLPSSNGVCEVERASSISTAIPGNMTRMQWVTWSDWEEGTQVESGIENYFSVNAQISAATNFSWAIAAGDERTVDHYEIYVSADGVNAADLGAVRTGLRQTNLASLTLASGNYQFYVDAVGKPCIRDHLSAPAAFYVGGAPYAVTNVQPASQFAWPGDSVSFSVVAGGSMPISYQWTVNGQNIPGATNSSYTLSALAGTNYYSVLLGNSYGTNSANTVTVVGVQAAYITGSNIVNYNSMPITFRGYTNGVTLQDFPVLVRLSTNLPGFSYSQFVSPATGADLRFTTTNGRVLPFQIDQWNPSGESQVWVQVPSITTTNDYITAWWGNPADSAMPSADTNGQTWTTLNSSNNFLVVYHLNQSGFPYADSTLQYPAVSGVAPTLTGGEIGNGEAFNGTSEFLDSGLVNLSKTFTLSAWVNIAPNANSEQTIWCNKSGGWNVAGFDFYVDSWQTNDGIIYFDSADGVSGNVSARTVAHAVSFGQWHQLTGTMDGVNGSVHVYIDGLDQTINTNVDTAFQVTNYVRLGSLLTGSPGATGSTCFDGSMDEARIEGEVRPAAWVWASWATVADSAFAAYGAVVPATPTLQYQWTGSHLILTWTGGTLQGAASVNGPYTNLNSASSPYDLVPSASQQYFRTTTGR